MASEEHSGQQANTRQGKTKVILYWYVPMFNTIQSFVGKMLVQVPSFMPGYELEKSRAQRILWLLEELKIDYELKTYKRVNMLAPPELKKVHPLGKSPLVSVQAEGAAEPLVLAESGLITEYLVEHFGPSLAPKRYQEGKDGQIQGETEEWLRYRYFMHYAEGTLMPYLVTALLLRTIKEKSPFFIRPIASAIVGNVESMYLNPNLEQNFKFLENQVKSAPDNGGYLCGAKLTAADILMSFPLSAAKGRAGLTKEKYPALWDYVDRLEAMEGNKRASQKIIEVDGSYKPSL
ncbi:MAG: hypothetical protein Q9178_006899 [Gyalolechia marmorata]